MLVDLERCVRPLATTEGFAYRNGSINDEQMLLFVESDDEALAYPLFIQGFPSARPLGRAIHIRESFNIHGRLAISNIDDH
jgi:hypothetical protein